MTISLLHAALVAYGFFGLITADVAFETVAPKNKFEWWLNGLLITSLWPILLLARLTYYVVRKIASK